jgi:hypothetical protein
LIIDIIHYLIAEPVERNAKHYHLLAQYTDDVVEPDGFLTDPY